MSLIAANGLIVERDGRRVLELDHCSLERGELVGVLGPNGCGKTTLLSTLCGVRRATRGSISVDGHRIESLTHAERARHIGYLPQGARFHWPVRVRDAVELGRYPHRDIAPGNRSGDDEAVATAMMLTGIAALAERTVDTLSGGECMRVHLARLLAGQHRALIADEPITSLDPAYQLQFLDVLANLANAGVGMLVSLHDLNLALRYCHRVIVLHDGRVAAAGVPEAVLTGTVLREVFAIEAEIIATGAGAALIPRRALSREP